VVLPRVARAITRTELRNRAAGGIGLLAGRGGRAGIVRRSDAVVVVGSLGAKRAIEDVGRTGAQSIL
jgi:hypothetical protein